MSRRRLFSIEGEKEICRLYWEERLSTTRKLAKEFGCSQRTIGRIMHRNGSRLRSQSEVQKGKFGSESRAWKGGRRKCSSGFVWIKSREHPFRHSKGYVYEHRLVVEKGLGRYLDPKEVVHHINGVRDDNRPENLMLFESSGEHLRYHRKLREYKVTGARKEKEKL